MSDATIVWEFGDAVVFVFEDEELYRVVIRYSPFIFDDVLVAEDMLEYFMNGTWIFENGGYLDILYTHPIVANIEAVVNSLILNINKLAQQQTQWDVFADYWTKIEKIEEILSD